MLITYLSLNETCLKEGSTVSLHCNTRGFPRPRIEFQQDGIEIIPGAEWYSNVLMEHFDQACPHACMIIVSDICGVLSFKNIHIILTQNFFYRFLIMNVTMSAGGLYSGIATSVSSLQLQITQQFDSCSKSNHNHNIIIMIIIVSLLIIYYDLFWHVLLQLCLSL